MSAAMETDPTEDTDESLDQLDDEHQKEGQVHEPQNNEDRVSHPLVWAYTNRNLEICNP
jgi:hypothetical protein